MKQILILLLLASATTAGQCASDDAAQFESMQFEAWFVAQGETLDLWPCCDELRWSRLAGVQEPCVGDDTHNCRSDLVSQDLHDRKGLKRDTYYFVGFQFASLGVLYMMPESISSWDEEDKDTYSLSKWWYNVTHPTWDEDDFFLNYVTHPYWGAAYFVRARERGYSNRESFWYSAMLSSMYEFGVEALFEPASIQDLFVTPVFGSLLGRYFMGVRDRIELHSLERGYRTTKDKWILALTDPLGAINRTVDRWLGHDADLQLRPYLKVNKLHRSASFGPPAWEEDREIGLAFSLRW